jgi:threonine synthase
MLPRYDLQGRSSLPVDVSQPGLFRYRDLLPLREGTAPVSLYEGGTPLVPVPLLAQRLGVEHLLIKDETRNPTWSYKDRLAAVATTKAVEMGVDTVVVASTGNHGAAVAAYAAAAGIRCVVLTVESVPPTMKTLMQVYGAHVVALRSPPDRWKLMAQLVAERGWLPMSGHANPPVGSNPYGVDGYKTIAYELVEELGRAPDVVVVPVAYADGLAGIGRGFADLNTLGVIDGVPRLVAAEPFGPLRAALDSGTDRTGHVDVRPSVAFSITSPVCTYQGIAALRASGGNAIVVSDNNTILAAQAEIGRRAGLYLEASAAIALPALEQMARSGDLYEDSTVVMVGTSTGLKDPDATARELPPVSVIEANPKSLDAALRESFSSATDVRS